MMDKEEQLGVRCSGKGQKASWEDDRAFLNWAEGAGAVVISNELKVGLTPHACCMSSLFALNNMQSERK